MYTRLKSIFEVVEENLRNHTSMIATEIVNAHVIRLHCFRLLVILCLALTILFLQYLSNVYGSVPIKYGHFGRLNKRNESRFEIERPEFRWCHNKTITNFSSFDEFPFDCRRLFDGSATEEQLHQSQQWAPPCSFKNYDIEVISKDCDLLKESFPFWANYKIPRNRSLEFPLAFVLIANENAEQVIRLLQSVFHPSNLYCITYDEDADQQFKNSMNNIMNCHSDNIVMPGRHLHINWAGFSILNSIMNCLEVLDAQKVSNIDWRYVQMLSWNDFPLRTNDEMSVIGKLLNGSQDAELAAAQPERFMYYYVENQKDQAKKNLTKKIAPGNLTPYKGSLAVTLSRDFVHFLIKNPLARQFYEWSSTSLVPEEQFWSTLVHNLHIDPPGGYPGTCLQYYQHTLASKPIISRFQDWGKKCGGKYVRSSCVYGVKDLPQLIQAPHLVAHKFYLDFEPAAYYCLSQLHYNRTFGIKSLVQQNAFDEKFYANLPGIRYHNMNDEAKKDYNCL